MVKNNNPLSENLSEDTCYNQPCFQLSENIPEIGLCTKTDVYIFVSLAKEQKLCDGPRTINYLEEVLESSEFKQFCGEVCVMKAEACEAYCPFQTFKAKLSSNTLTKKENDVAREQLRHMGVSKKTRINKNQSIAFIDSKISFFKLASPRL